MTTRAVWLRRELDRAETSNDGTLLPSFFPILNADRGPGLEVGTSFEKAFLAHYAAIRELLNAHEEQGLGLVAAGPDGLEASVWFVAKPDEANPLILGRHSSAEVFLPSDPALSLRHLAVILHRQGVGSPVRFRVLDLRTPNGFQDERGRSLEALASEGPLMIRCASFAVMMFPTGGGNPPWPEDPHQAWARVPERLYTAARVAGEEGMPKDAPWVWHTGSELELADPGAATLVPSFPGPTFASRDLAASDTPRGELLVGTGAGKAALRLGALAAAQGVLLGRYERCDTAGIPGFSDGALSRVHLLVIDLDGALYAVDTASTNGSWLGSES
ncbi:MAG TPA: hypothetical protein VMV21_09505, partial [Vicinamibacteria bacterium]|nr:hypothetical protein [Vicinamibacteria bacterium]